MTTSGALLEVRDLSVSFGGVHALAGVDLCVEEGSVTGLIGPNGAGKTTFIDAVTGFVAPSVGEVVFDGRDLTTASPSERARHGLVRTFQSLELFEDLTVGENLAAAAEPERWWTVLAEAVGRRPASTADEDVEWALGLVGLAGCEDLEPGELSHGQRRLVSVARALASRPQLVLLDEPAAGLDTAETARLGAHLGRLADAGVSVLLVDHDMSLVLDVCSQVHVLDFGRVLASGPPDEVRRDPVVVAAYLGVTT